MNAHQPTADETLAGRAAGGDDRAFAELVRRHKRGLYRLLRRYLGDRDEAYDAVQETFIAAWSAIGRYDSRRPFLAWLRTIGINKARDHARRAAVRRLLHGRQSGDRPEPAVPIDREMIEAEKLAALDRAVARLPAALKGPLVLTAFEGLSHKEAAVSLGVTPKAIETRCRRARATLAAALRAPALPDLP